MKALAAPWSCKKKIKNTYFCFVGLNIKFVYFMFFPQKVFRKIAILDASKILILQ